MAECQFSFTDDLYADHYHLWIMDREANWGHERPVPVGGLGEDDVRLGHLRVVPESLDAYQTCLSINTNTYGCVRVLFSIWDTQPEPDPGVWDQIIEASIALPSGTLSILDGRDAIDLSPGEYRARILYGNYWHEPDDCDGFHGEHYRIDLWPAPAAPPSVLQYAPPDPPGREELFYLDAAEQQFLIRGLTPPLVATVQLALSPSLTPMGAALDRYDGCRIPTLVRDDLRVSVELCDRAPRENRLPWDAIVEATLWLPEGVLILESMGGRETALVPMMEVFDLDAPGLYRMRLHWQVVGDLSEPARPEIVYELFRIVLWPGEAAPPWIG